MFRSLALSTVVVLATTTAASADFYFGTGTIQTGTASVQTDVNRINGDAALGVQFINTVNNGAGNNAFTGVAGSPSQVGFHTVGANLLSTYGLQSGGAVPATYNGNPVVAVFAVQGYTQGGGSVINITNGSLGFYSIPSLASFNQNNPATYGATSADGNTAVTPIASFTLTPGQQGVDKGPGQPGPGGGGPGTNNFAPNQFNQTSITLTVGSLNSGPFSFLESINPDFWNITGNPPTVPPGATPGPEGISVIVNEALQTATANNTQFIDGGPGEAGFRALNTIFNALVPGGSTFGFATGFGGLGSTAGPTSDFNPSTSTSGAPNTADSIFTLGSATSHFVTAQLTPVPEPMTLAVFGGVMGAGGLVYRKRRSAKVAV